MINYAHRGASTYFPENTMSSFYAGLTMGANGIETDVHMTKDGVLILFHDDTLDRASDGTGDIHQYTYEELRKLRIRNGDRVDIIPTFEDFLRQFGWRDLTFAIELKQAGIEREVIDMLRKYDMKEKTILTSFHFDSIKVAKEYAPEYRIGYLYHEKTDTPEEHLISIGGEELCPKATMLTKEYVAKYKAMGYSVRAWGIANEELMRHAVECGVDGMTINFPDKLTAYLANR